MVPTAPPAPRARLVFMGTPELARTILRALVDSSRWEIVLVVAQPDKPVGRGLSTQPPPVKVEALARGLPVRQPTKARDPDFLAELARLAPDVIVVAAYGQLLPPALLAIPRTGCLNVHTSLLPRWRGAAPIQWALLEGDSETGVTLMRMNEGLDTGDLVTSASTPISDDDTAQSLHDRLADLGADLLVRTLPAWLAGSLTPVPQPDTGVTYARKLTREDGRLDWSLPAETLARRVRALHPWPGAFTSLPPADGKGPGSLLKISRASAWPLPPPLSPASEAIATPGLNPSPNPSPSPGEVVLATGGEWLVATGRGALRLDLVQREGRQRLAAREFLAGHPIPRGTRLGG